MRKAVFCVVKGHLLQCNSRPFAWPENAGLCAPGRNPLACRHIPNQLFLGFFYVKVVCAAAKGVLAIVN